MRWRGMFVVAAVMLTCAAGARAEHEAARRLAKRIDVSFVETPLERAVQEIGRLANVAVVVDVDDIEREEFSQSVNVTLKDVPARMALDTILKGAYLSAVADGYAVRIVTNEQARFEHIALRTFDVRDLTYAATDFPGPDFNHATPADGCGHSGARVIAEGALSQCIDSESLAELVMARIHPDEWDAALGTSIEEQGGRLIVMQRPEILEKIARLIRTVRENMETAVRIEGGAYLVSTTALDAAMEKIQTPGFLGPDERRPFESRLIEAGARQLGRVRVTCFSGQRIHAYAGRMDGMVRDVNIIRGRLDLVTGVSFEGYCLEVRPVASHDGRFITFSANVQVSGTVAPAAAHTVLAGTSAATGDNAVGGSPAKRKAASKRSDAPQVARFRIRTPDIAKHEARVFLQMPSGHSALHCVPAASPCDEGKSVVFVIKVVAARSGARK
jgi:hypothetical protein